MSVKRCGGVGSQRHRVAKASAATPGLRSSAGTKVNVGVEQGVQFSLQPTQPKQPGSGARSMSLSTSLSGLSTPGHAAEHPHVACAVPPGGLHNLRAVLADRRPSGRTAAAHRTPDVARPGPAAARRPPPAGSASATTAASHQPHRRRSHTASTRPAGPARPATTRSDAARYGSAHLPTGSHQTFSTRADRHP